jgi:hypothetical protein
VELFPEFRLQKRGRTSLWLDRSLNGASIVDSIADPDSFFNLPECQIIKDERKIKVGRIPLEVHGKRTNIYLKRYNAFSWRYRVSSLFSFSGAVRSLKGAAILSQAKITTARPVAAMESRLWGMLDRSFFISEEIEGGRTADAYWRETLSTFEGTQGSRRRGNFLRNLAQLFRSLHEQHIYHDDLKDANILIAPGPYEGSELFYLLDLEGIRRYRNLSRRRRVKNLVQLNRTLGRYLRRTEKLRFLRYYLGPAFFNRGEKRSWIGRILQQSSRWDRRSTQKSLVN